MVAYTFIQVGAAVWATATVLSVWSSFLSFSGRLPPLKQVDDMNQHAPSQSRAASFPPTSAVPTLSTSATINNKKSTTPSPQQQAAPSTTPKTAYSAWFAPTTAAAAAPPTTTPVVERGSAVPTTLTTDTSSSPPPTASSWSFSAGFMAKAVVALAAAPLSLLILSRLFCTTAEKNSSGSGTSTPYSLIQAALQERLSGKGHKSTSMTSGGGLGWDAKNYAQLTMEEIQRLLAILNAPAYHKNSSRSSCGLNKRDLLHVLYQQYGNLLQDCNTQELRNILDCQGVAMPSGVIAKHDLVQMALHAGFTGATAVPY